MRRWTFVSSTAASIAVGSFAGGRPSTAFSEEPGAAVGTPPPVPTPPPQLRNKCVTGGLPMDRRLGLRMRVLDGPDFQLEKLLGHGVWLNFFATWCPGCNQMMPDVVEFSNRFADHGLIVVGVNFMEQDNPVRAFRERFHIKFPIAMDVDGGIFRRLRLQYLPSSMFVTPDGYLSCVMNGDLGRREIIKEITSIGVVPEDPPAAATPS